MRWDTARCVPRRRRARPASSRSPISTPATTRARAYFHVNQKRGRRWSAARGFLKPVLARPNLRLETGCLVEGIAFDGRRAAGVRWRQDGATRSARCRGEVILAAGSIGSPQLLLLSGVGPAARSARSRHSASCSTGPGVGENLQDHLQLRADLQGLGRQDAQRDLSFALAAARAWGSTMRCSAAVR